MYKEKAVLLNIFVHLLCVFVTIFSEKAIKFLFA